MSGADADAVAGTSAADNPYDIDGSNFQSELYLERLVRLGSLRQVLDKEAELVTQSQHLHSEMQTLVYENYNKFISATETVRQMRSDFRLMQSEMDRLSENVERIGLFGGEISGALRESGAAVGRLCAARRLLDRLQFLFRLPARLNEALARRQYAAAVGDYAHAQRVLQRYGGQPSFRGIRSECEDIVRRLRAALEERLLGAGATAAELAESAGLLVRLREEDDSLDEVYLERAAVRLEQHLQELSSGADGMDALEWVEKSNTTLLGDLGIIVSSYREMFLQKTESEMNLTIISSFTDKILDQYFKLACNILKPPSNYGTDILVRATDKFFRQLQAMTEIVPSNVITNRSVEIVIETVLHKSDVQYRSIEVQFQESLVRVRQSLASKGSENSDLKESLNSLEVYLIEKVQASLLDLMAFLDKGLSFGLKLWCVKAVSDACWKIISQTMINVAVTVNNFSSPQSSNNNAPFELLLILAKLCLELQDNGVTTLHTHMLKLLEEAAPGVVVENKDASNITVALATAAQAALDAEVIYIGQAAAQMLRVSVLARDWLRAPEPRGPRAVCRRVVEALASADTAAAQLFPMGTKQSSDSSRRTLWPRAPSSFSPINRIFSERIEVFGPAGADRAALSAGALKVALKALVECVRLRTFGRHGLQQLQVDVHFLQQRLSCMGNDERLLSALLEDALASAQLRCIDPQLMETSIVDVICDRG